MLDRKPSWDGWLGNNPSHSMDDDGAMQIDHDDGSITIDLRPSPTDYMGEDDADADPWAENIADKLTDGELNEIVADLMDGIDADQASRREMLEIQAKGIELLGLKVEQPTADLGSGALESMSKVRHPLLLEAVLRAQANLRGELLPTDGPVKIRNDDTDSYIADEQAEYLESDLNHYLTSTASEYVPDTDRMLMVVVLDGGAFKKVYHCPRRMRPVSESVDIKDLIVSNTATDLGNAARITHVIRMRPSILRRMQLLGVYRDIDLGEPASETKTAVDAKVSAQEGVIDKPSRTEDAEHTVYECYCELDIPGYEHKIDGEPSGLPLPYRVSIEVTSRKILEIAPNWEEGDDGLPLARECFVLFPYVPGFGFYPIGLLHILGNTTLAATSAWRELLDAGMFANFPGFLYAKAPGTRQMTNQFRVPPGGGAGVETTSGQDIRQAVMPLPYKEPGATTMQLVENIVQSGQRVGGTADTPVGEGSQNAPVGTTLALIEQQTKVESAVHKRLHCAQAKEFQLLKKLFAEDPSALFRHSTKAKLQSEQAVRLALRNNELVPQADPNTHSRLHRLAKGASLIQLNQAMPGAMNQQELLRRILEMMQVGDIESLIAPPAGPPQPDPVKMAMLQDKDKDRQMKLLIEQMKQGDAAKDRQSRENVELLEMARELAVHPDGEQSVSDIMSSVPRMLPQPPQGTLQ